MDRRDDDAALRGKPFAFWELDPRNEGKIEGLADWATIRIRVLGSALRSDQRIVLRMPGASPTPVYGLKEKAGTGKDYLKNAARSSEQLESLQLRVFASSPGGLQLPPLGVGEHEFLIACRSCRGSTFTLESYDVASKSYVLLDSAPVDVKALDDWLTVYSVRRPGTFSPAARGQRVEGPEVPAEVKQVTVLLHGFNVTEESARASFFPTYFKRLYWVGHPVLRRQGNDSDGYAHTVGIAWPGNQGFGLPGPVDEGVYFPEDEFHALQSGVPVSGILKDLASGRRLDVIAHSLGNMVVNSALMQPGMSGVVRRFVMNDPAIAADAFDPNYPYSPQERTDYEFHARRYGFPDDAFWQAEWDDMNAGRPYREADGGPVPDYTDLLRWEAKLRDEINPALYPKPRYELRWRQVRVAEPGPVGTSETPERGPWRGLFAGNTSRAAIYNTFNTGDRILGLLWPQSQTLQKPNRGVLGLGSDNRIQQFWALLKNTGAEEEYLWEFSGTHANITRQWAELAHWFSSRSQATGRAPVDAVTSVDLSRWGGSSLSEPVQTHGYMTGRPLSDVWGGYETLRDLFK